MKCCLTFLILILIPIAVWSQENAGVLQGGYSYATVDGTNTTATGWRITGLYEFTPVGGKWAFGGSFGYISLSGTENTPPSTITYDLSSIPIYLEPRFMFGGAKLRGFLKGAIGVHFSKIKRTGTFILFEDNRWGLVSGLGAGIMYAFSEKVYLNAEYEMLWMPWSYYKNSLVSTAAIGVGIKF